MVKIFGELSSVFRDAELRPGAGDGLGLLGLLVIGGGVAGLRLFQFVRGGHRIDLGGGDRAVGQDGDDVVADLGEPAVDEVALGAAGVLVRSSP